MKKELVLVFVAAAIVSACASASKNGTAEKVYGYVENKLESGIINKDNNTASAPLRSVVIDWSDRTMGQVSNPDWLKSLVVNNNSQAVQSAFGIDPSNKIKFSVGKDANIENARIDAGILHAQKLAHDLKQYVVTAVARRADQGVVDRLEEITTATKVTITGNERVADFWKLVETNDNGQKRREYTYYVVWSMPQTILTQILRKYVNDIIVQEPDTAVKRQIAAAYNDIQKEAELKQERSDAEFRQQLKRQEQEAKNAQKRAMAQINQQGATNQAMAGVAQTQAQAEADARYAAYRSGNPAVAAVAATTAADIDWISALAGDPDFTQ